MRKYVKYIIGALLIVGVLGSAAVAYAAQGVDLQDFRQGFGGPGKGGRGVGGEITAVNGDTITVQNPRGDEGIIVTNAETEFIVNGETGSLADVAVGKFAKGVGERQDDGSVLAVKVMVVDELPERGKGMPGHPGKGPRVGGEVTAVDDNTITVQNPRDGEGSIVTNDETEFIVNGEAGSLADVAVGKFVGAGGEMQDDGSILADRVMVHDDPLPPPGGPGKGGRGVGGEITAVNGDTITVQNPRGDEGTIVTNDETEFIVNGEAGSMADVAVGKFAKGVGEKQDDGSVLAAKVMVVDELPERGQGKPGHPGKMPGIGGEVTGVAGTTITVQNPRGETGTILTNDDTRFIVNREAGSLADVAAGKFVMGIGEKQDDGSVVAVVVIVLDELPTRPKRSEGAQGFFPGGGQQGDWGFQTY